MSGAYEWGSLQAAVTNCLWYAHTIMDNSCAHAYLNQARYKGCFSRTRV